MDGRRQWRAPSRRDPRLYGALAGAAMLVGALGCGVGYRMTAESYDPALGIYGAFDAYIPSASASGALRPGVLVVHGGGWTSGSKEDLAEEAGRLANAGFFVANVNYRLSPAAQYPLPVQDVWCALAAVRGRAAEFGVDPDRLALLGYSAGGYLVEMVGLSATPERADCPGGTTGAADAVVAGDAPADLLHLPSLGDGLVEALVGVSKGADPAQYTADSPLAHVGPGAPPFLLIHGTVDLYVDSSQTQALQGELMAQGDTVALLLLGGGGHTLNVGPDLGGLDYIEDTIDAPEAWSAILEFLQVKIGRPPL